MNSFVKSFIIVLLTLTFTTNIGLTKERWIITQRTDNSINFLDMNSITYDKSKNQVRYWVKLLMPNDNYGSMGLHVIDLTSKRMGNISSVVFDNNGKITEKEERTIIEWSYIVPDDLVEKRTDIVCTKLGLPKLFNTHPHNWNKIFSRGDISWYICSDAFHYFPQENTCIVFVKTKHGNSFSTITYTYSCNFNERTIKEMLLKNEPFEHVIPDTIMESIYDAAFFICKPQINFKKKAL